MSSISFLWFVCFFFFFFSFLVPFVPPMSTGPWFVAFVRNDEATSRRKLLLSRSRRSFAQNSESPRFQPPPRFVVAVGCFLVAEESSNSFVWPTTVFGHDRTLLHVIRIAMTTTYVHTTTYELPTYYVIDYGIISP